MPSMGLLMEQDLNKEERRSAGEALGRFTTNGLGLSVGTKVKAYELKKGPSSYARLKLDRIFSSDGGMVSYFKKGDTAYVIVPNIDCKDGKYRTAILAVGLREFAQNTMSDDLSKIEIGNGLKSYVIFEDEAMREKGGRVILNFKRYLADCSSYEASNQVNDILNAVSGLSDATVNINNDLKYVLDGGLILKGEIDWNPIPKLK